MNFFERLFRSKETNIPVDIEPNVLFGKYTDRNKTKEQHDSWDKAVNLYREKKYLDSYYEFFNYIRDEKEQNVTFEKLDNKINFTLIQGSKIVHGSLNEKEIQAEAEVARFTEQNIAVMRKLLKENHFLYFSKFAVRNNIYTLKYFSPVVDAQPSSLYYALKEISTEADMYDDVLVDEFDCVEPINIEHIEAIGDDEKETKLKYLKKWINETIEDVAKFDSDKFIGAVAYLLLNLTFKIYHLLSPEGTLLDEIRYIQSLFYREDNRSLKEKLVHMQDEYLKLLEKPDDDIRKSFYKVKATFAVAQPTSHKAVVNFFKSELGKKESYIDNDFIDFAEEVCKYVVYYACFFYGLPTVAQDVLLVFWKVFNPDFFNELGFKHTLYDNNTDSLNKESIKNEITKIIKLAKKKHPQIAFSSDNLNFSNRLDFAISFIEEFQKLNYD